MQSASIPATEADRIAALQALDVLDTGPEKEFDALIRVASLVCGVPISLISLVDVERQWFKANIGLPGVSETPRDIAFCSHAILDDGLFVVPDAAQDPRFFDNPLVTHQPDIRFYAGAPITLANGNRIGTLCVIDRQPRQLDAHQREILQSLAVAAAQALQGRSAMRQREVMAQELRKSQGLLNRAGRMAGVGGWEVDLMNNTIYWSEETRRIHGVPPDYVPEMAGAIDFYAPEARGTVQSALEVAMAGGSGWDFELPFIRLDGARIWVRTVGVVEFEHTKPVRVVGAFQDVTQQRTERELLRAAQERVLVATESGGIGIWERDVVSNATVWDAQVYRLFGLSAADPRAPDALWQLHVHPEDQAASEEAMRLAIATKSLLSINYRVIWPDGSVHYLKGYGRVQQDIHGHALSVVGTNWDVTEAAHHAQVLKDALDKAEVASQSKGQFLANMSHEIRTPMNAILGLLNLLQTTELTARQRDYAGKTEGAAKSLLGLLNDILDFSKVEAGKLTLEQEPFRLDQLLRGLSVILSANVGTKDIEVLFDVDPALPAVVLGDALRLQQVLINLGGNAIKFTSNGQVVLALKAQDQAADRVVIEFSIQDSGVGIAPEHQGHIFSGFSQAEASTTRRFGGTGLGLAICKRLVELMGGEIRLSSALGQGSRFSFAIALPVVREEPPILLGSATPSLPPRRVLVIDDNPIARALMMRTVQSWGWPVEVAASGAEAMEVVQSALAAGDGSFPFSLVFVDWQMPGMDGWETTRQLRNLSLQCSGLQPSIIMVTAHGRETLAQRSSEEQDMLNGFLVKPTTASMLFDAILDVQTGHPTVRQGPRARSSQRQLHGMRILVVEDNLINQQVADELLSAEGAIVLLAANGQQGVDAVAAAAPQFDVVLMDIQMPVMDGYTATRFIREQLGLHALPIVAMTANAMSSDRDACLAAGMNEHIGKPFDMAKLVSTLIRLTQLEPDLQWVDGTEDDRVTAPLPDVPGLDLKTALARLSGMRSLYSRTASEFAALLDDFVPELQARLSGNEHKIVLRRLHTLKGNAATLGAMALANLAASLESKAKEDLQTDSWKPALDELAAEIESTQIALRLAVKYLASGAMPAIADAVVPAGSEAALPVLREIAALLAASDLEVLQKFAESRAVLSVLPDGFCDAMEAALQSLDLEAAHVHCQAMIQSLQETNKLAP